MVASIGLATSAWVSDVGLESALFPKLLEILEIRSASAVPFAVISAPSSKSRTNAAPLSTIHSGAVPPRFHLHGSSSPRPSFGLRKCLSKWSWKNAPCQVTPWTQVPSCAVAYNTHRFPQLFLLQLALYHFFFRGVSASSAAILASPRIRALSKGLLVARAHLPLVEEVRNLPRTSAR
jgi:hypothetical protein